MIVYIGENGKKLANQQSEELSILIMGSKGSVGQIIYVDCFYTCQCIDFKFRLTL